MTLGRWSPMVALGILLAAWIIATALGNLWSRLRSHPSNSWAQRFRAQAGSYYGMLLAHLGVAVFIIGVTIVGGYASENDVRMEPGQTASVGGFDFKLDSVSERSGPNYTATRAHLTVTRNGQAVAELEPERRLYHVRRMPLTEVAIDRGLTRDLYVALGEPVDKTAWSVRLHHKPFVNWIWLGCVLMALGGVLAVLDRRYRLKGRASSTAASASTGGDTRPIRSGPAVEVS